MAVWGCVRLNTFSPRRRPIGTPPNLVLFLFFFLPCLFLLHLFTIVSLSLTFYISLFQPILSSRTLSWPSFFCFCPNLLNFVTLIPSFLILLLFLFLSFFLLPSFLPSLSQGVVPEQEDEGQTTETLLAVASPSCRPPGGAPDGPGISFLHPAVPLHPAAPPTPPPPPPLPPGSLLTSILSSPLLQCTHEDPGCTPPLPVPQQSRGAASNHSSPLPLHQRCAPSRLMSLPPLPALGTRTTAKSQGAGTGTEPAT